MRRQGIVLGCVSFAIFVVGCAKRQSSYFPIKAGLTWSYQYVRGGNSGTLKFHTLDQREIGSTMATPLVEEGTTTFTQFVVSRDSGIYEIAYQSMSDPEPQVMLPQCVLKFPLKVGTTWNYYEVTYLLSSALYKVNNKPVLCKASAQSVSETVTTPAGTFYNCVRVVKRGKTSINVGMFYMTQTLPVDIEESEWYAPDIGLVKAIYKQTVPTNSQSVYSGELDEQLESFNQK